MVKTKFQTKDYKFPKKGFVCGLWIADRSGKPRHIFFLVSLYSDKSEIIKDCQKIVSLNSPDYPGRFFDDWILVMSLEFEKLHELDKSLWESPNFKYESPSRDTVLDEAVLYYKDYRVLVTPSDVEVPFRVAFAYPSEQIEKLKLFMETSDWYVDPEAKNVGIYPDFANLVFC